MTPISVITSIWGRHEVVRIMAAGLKRIEASGYALNVFAAVSNTDDEQLAVSYGWTPVRSPNFPLGNKWNNLLRYALEHSEADYFVQTGSDDLFSARLIEAGIEAVAHGYDIAGVKDLYFVDYHSERAVKWRYNTREGCLCGAGRFISRKCAESAINSSGQMEFWPPEAENTLDGLSEMAARKRGHTVKELLFDRPQVVDVKTVGNIWNFERFWSRNFAVPLDEALWFAGPVERKLLEDGR